MRRLLCLGLLCLPAVADAAAPFPLVRDANGDLLPFGARLRIPSAKWELRSDRMRLGLPPVVSADGERVACANGGAVRVFDARTRRCLARLPGNGGDPFLLTFSHDGKRLVGIEGGTLYLWEVRNREKARRFGNRLTFAADRTAVQAAFLPGEGLATWDGRSLIVWDGGGKRLREDRLGAHDEAGSFSPDGRWFACQVGGALVLVDLTTGRWSRSRLPRDGERASTARWAWSRDGRRLALTCTAALDVWVHDAADGRLLARLKGASDLWYPALAFSPDGRSLAVASLDSITVWDILGRKSRTLETGHLADGPLLALAYQGERRLLAFDSKFGVGTWDPQSGVEVGLGGQRGPVAGLAFSGGGRTLVSAGGGTLFRWDVPTGRPLKRVRLTAPEASAVDVSASSCGRFAAVTADVGERREAVVFDLGRGRAVWAQEMDAPFRGGLSTGDDTYSTVTRCAFSGCGSLCFVPPAGGQAEVRHSSDGRLVQKVKLPVLHAAALNGDGTELVAAATEEGRTVIRVYELRTGRRVRQWKVGRQEEDGPLTVLTLSPDGRLVATADDKHLIFGSTHREG